MVELVIGDLKESYRWWKMKKGDRVRHKRKGWIGTIHQFGKYLVLVDWSDHFGVRCRWARGEDLEVLHDD